MAAVAPNRAVRLVGIGGTVRPHSSTERVLRHALDAARQAGADVEMLGAEALQLPMYDPTRPDRTPNAQRLVAAVARADGLVIASPGYHGGVSGLVKNALDYLEDLRDAEQPYLDGRAVGCIACAAGWQAAAATLAALRGVVHALRGWPTPLGLALNTSEPVFDQSGVIAPGSTARQLHVMSAQVVSFARSSLHRSSDESSVVRTA